MVAIEDPERRIYGIQFHPEVSHTLAGNEMLHNFLLGACGATADWRMASYLQEAVASIRKQARTGRRKRSHSRTILPSSPVSSRC